MNEKLLESWENSQFSTSYYEVVLMNSDHKEYKCVVKNKELTGSIYVIHSVSFSDCKNDTEKLLPLLQNK